MIITEKQLLIMLRAFEGTLTIADRNDRNMFGICQEDRIKVYNEIINQQSDVKKEISDV